MKAMKRKLLSLLLAMAMILTLAPTALAAEGDLTLSPPTNLKMGAITTGDITVTGLPQGVTAANATWTSDNESVVTVAGGTVTAVSAGSTTVRASYTHVIPDLEDEEGNTIPGSTTVYSGSCTVRVAEADVPVTEVTLDYTTLTLTAGTSGQLTATVSPENATTGGVNWSVSDENKASVSTSGLVSIDVNATGSVIVTATSKGDNASGQKETASCTVTITEATVDHIDFSGNPTTMNAGETKTVTATPKTASNQALTKPVTWAVVSPSALPVGITVTYGSGADANKVTIATTSALTTDTDVTVSATVDGKTNSFTVKVKAYVASIPVTLTPSTVAAGETSVATATIPSNLVYGTHYTDVVWTSSTTAATVTQYTGNKNMARITANATGTPTIKVQLKNGNTVVAEGSAVLTISGSAVYISTSQNGGAVTSCDLPGYGSTATLYAHVAGKVQNPVYSWYLANNGDKILYAPTNSNLNYSYLNIQAIATGKTTVYLDVYEGAVGTKNLVGSASVAINVGYTGSVYATATVSTSTSSYALGDTDDAGKSSILSQLDSYFYSAANNRYGLAYVIFGNVRDGNNGSLNASTNTYYYADRQGSGSNPKYLADVLFTPGTAKTTATFQATFYYYNNQRYQQTAGDISSVTGAITFNVVEDASSGDITYSASIGEDVSFTMKDFEDFYYTKTRGSLSYVTFTLPSGGSLYSDGGRLTTSNACYVSPRQSQIDLAGVYFSPSGTTATRAGTVRISFTAYGNRTSAAGTVAITYLSGAAKDITYNISTSGTLKASDFTAAYKEVVGSNAPTGLTIQFQNVPTNGTLTYKDSSRSNSSVVTLRANNIKTYKFTTRTSGSNQLGDVTYTASGSRSDTIDYIAYVNNTPQFTGKVVFNATNASASNMQVGFTSTNGQAVTFSYAEFAKANATVIASTSYIRFVTMPTGGTLTYNGTVMTLSSTNVPPTMLGSVVYRPNAGFNNSTDRIGFLCYDANGNSVGGGQVNIVVTGNANNAAVTTVNSFKDVSSTAWYRNDLITLVNAGIIQGRGDGKFDPTAELTYGEALKIFMLASGYPAQTEASGKDWAINYKNLAVSNGWISSSVDLSAKISRNAMAELAAKSLGVASSSTVPPTWKDGTSNGYSNALYYTDPQILIGNADGTFKGNDTLKRQEICAIACRVMNYRSNQQSSEKPGWLG